MSNSKTWQEIFSATPSIPAARTYCIAFTPRSGSTWLGDTLKRSQNFGDPREYFNADAANYIISHSKASSLPEYFEYLKTVRQSNGLFGFEVTHQHIAKLMKEGYADIMDDVDTWFCLRRKNFVAQAVSLYRASHTGVYHSHQKQQSGLEETPYNQEKIARVALNLMAAEFRLQKFFTEREIKPKELWYEEITALPPSRILQIFAEEIGQPERVPQSSAEPAEDSQLEKVSDNDSEILISRFKEKNQAFIDYWDEHRGQKSIMQFCSKHPAYAIKTQIPIEPAN